MSLALGVILLAVTVAMIMVARPADGESASFLKNWFVGQLYALGAMVSAVAGGTMLVVAWPL